MVVGGLSPTLYGYEISVSTLVGSDSLVTMKDSWVATKDASMIHDDVIPNVAIPSTENGLLPLTPSISSCVDTTFAPPVSGDLVSATIVAPSSGTLFSTPERSVKGPSDWSVGVGKVEDAWINFKGKHSKTSKPSFDMTQVVPIRPLQNVLSLNQK